MSSARVEPRAADRRGVDRPAGESTHRSAVATRSPVVYLAAVVGLSVLVRLAIGLATPSPWILPDELLYTELARAIADGGLPAVRGDATLGWGVVYPLLIAPAWALFSDPVAAYHASLVVNAVVMSLAAVPAYLLARLFVPTTPALLVAAGSVLVPSMALTATVMTENAAYPLFLLAVWLMARTVRNPTLGGQAAMLAAIVALAATRVSGAVVLPALLVAAGLYALTSRPGERIAYLRRFTPTVVVLAAVVALPLLADLAGGGGVGWFGQRSGTLQYVDLGPFLRLLLYQTGDLILYAAVLPALAAAVMVGIGLSRRAAEPERLYAAVALPSVRRCSAPGSRSRPPSASTARPGSTSATSSRSCRCSCSGSRSGSTRGCRGRVGRCRSWSSSRWCRRCCPGTRSRWTRASTRSRWLRGWRCPSGASARGSSSRCACCWWGSSGCAGAASGRASCGSSR